MTQHPHTLTTEESERLLKALADTGGIRRRQYKATRNTTMSMLMLDAGLRVGEVVRLIRSDLWFNGEPVTSLVVPASITKTRTERIVPLTERLRTQIEQMDTQWWNIGFGKVTYAFRPKVASRPPLTTRQVERIIRAAAIAAIGRPVHPHMLRHTFASRLMRVTNARTVQQLLGHKQLSSTQIYTHPNADDLKTAITQMSDNSTPNL